MVLYDEHMRQPWVFSILRDKQMSNWLGVERWLIYLFNLAYVILIEDLGYNSIPDALRML